MEETACCLFVISPAGTLGGAGARKYLGLGGRGGGRGDSLKWDKTGRLEGELSLTEQPVKQSMHKM